MYLFLDVETTGLPETPSYGKYYSYELIEKYQEAQIVQFSMIISNEDYEIINEYDAIILTKKNITNSHIHGITNEINREKGITFDTAMNVFNDYLPKITKIYAHNSNFDINVIKSQLYNSKASIEIEKINNILMILGEMEKNNKIVCTMKLTKEIVKALDKKGRIKDPKLSELYLYVMKEELINAHNSLYDCKALHKIMSTLYMQKKILKIMKG